MAEASSLVLPPTRILQVDLNDRINVILGSLPFKVHLTASNVQKLGEPSKRLPLINHFDLSPTGIPGPKSVESSSSIASEVSSYARAFARRHNSSRPGYIMLYHLHRSDDKAPIKFYILWWEEMGRERWYVLVVDGQIWPSISKCM